MAAIYKFILNTKPYSVAGMNRAWPRQVLEEVIALSMQTCLPQTVLSLAEIGGALQRIILQTMAAVHPKYD
jgi:hypothetical protein